MAYIADVLTEYKSINRSNINRSLRTRQLEIPGVH